MQIKFKELRDLYNYFGLTPHTNLGKCRYTKGLGVGGCCSNTSLPSKPLFMGFTEDLTRCWVFFRHNIKNVFRISSYYPQLFDCMTGSS